MPWPVPAPADIADRGAAVFESTPGLEGIDARSPNTVATAYVRVVGMAAEDLYLYQAYLARELFVDTAVDFLPVHAAMWGVPQLQPTAAAGNVLVAGAVGAPVPIGVNFTSAGNQIYLSTAAVNIGSGGTVLVPVAATVKGSAGNLAAGSVLTITSPVANIYPQKGTVDSNGLSGGEDLEDPEDWRARILEKIRITPMGGAAADYVAWAQDALTNVKYVNPVPRMFGLGTVGVVFAMVGPAIPSSGEVSTVQAYLDVVAPVTAEVTALAATFNAVNVSLHLNPDTTLIRAAATVALQLSFLQDAQIGGTTEFSRLDAAVASSDGEYSHDMLVNGAQADVPAPSQLAMNVLGTVSFT
jgi:uncharacterized phage protein gp47/JayE